MTQTRPAPPRLDIPALNAAARVLHDLFLKDVQSIPDLADLIPRPCSPPPSAHPVHPLPATGPPSSASYSVFPDDYRIPFQKRRLVGIPDALFQYYNSASRLSLSPPRSSLHQPPASPPTWASSQT